MGDDSFAELSKLKQRLENLGVKIKGGGLPDAVPFRDLTDSQVNRDDVGRLLERCSRVEAALQSVDKEASDTGIALEPAYIRRSPSLERQVIVHPRSPPHAPRPAHGRKGAKQPFVPTSKPAQRVPDRPRTNPLSNLLADYREAEARWNHERAELRRQVAHEKKRANTLEAALGKLKNTHETRMTDNKALRGALANRDEHLKVAHQRCRELEQAHFQAAERAARDLATATSEREDLKSLLMATLARLEAVDDVVRRADTTNAALEARVAAADSARAEAAGAAAAAQARVDALLKSQRRIEWQNKMLDRISEVQMQHNRQKTAAMAELLGQHSAEHDGGESVAAGGAMECASTTDCTRTDEL